MNKTTAALKLAEEAAEFARNICLGMNWSTDLPDEALAAIREVLAESKPAPDGRIPKTVFTIEDIGKAAEMGRQAGMVDALAEQALQKLSDFHQYMEATEPVAVISESAIGLVKLHSNGACLPFGTQLYAAPVDAKTIRAEALEEAYKAIECCAYYGNDKGIERDVFVWNKAVSYCAAAIRWLK